jgi:hypothetical protein
VKPLFTFGRVVATPGAVAAIGASGDHLSTYLALDRNLLILSAPAWVAFESLNELAIAPQAAETPVMVIGIRLGFPSWQVQFCHNLLYSGFVFQNASINEKRILFSRTVIGYGASRAVIMFGLLRHRPGFLKGLPIHVMTAFMDSEVTIDFTLGNRCAVNQKRLAHEEDDSDIGRIHSFLNSQFAVLRIFRAFEQVVRFGLGTKFADAILMAAPKARRFDLRLVQVAQGAGRSAFPICGYVDAGGRYILLAASLWKLNRMLPIPA